MLTKIFLACCFRSLSLSVRRGCSCFLAFLSSHPPLVRHFFCNNKNQHNNTYVHIFQMTLKFNGQQHKAIVFFALGLVVLLLQQTTSATTSSTASAGTAGRERRACQADKERTRAITNVHDKTRR